MAKASSSNVERGAEILLKLGDAVQQGLTLTELAELLGETKPATHRALVGLSKRGFVQQTGRRGRYYLGPTIYTLAMTPFSTRAIVEKVRPALIEISNATGGGTYLLARGGLDAVCLDVEEGKYIIPSTVGGIGGRQPLGMGAASICILGMLDKRARSVILSSNEARIADTISLERVQASLEFFEQHGYAINTPNVQQSSAINIAVAVPQEKIRTLAAVAVILPDRSQIDSEHIAKTIKTIVHSFVE